VGQWAMTCLDCGHARRWAARAWRS
jgi:RNase P subunit RPR2